MSDYSTQGVSGKTLHVVIEVTRCWDCPHFYGSKEGGDCQLKYGYEGIMPFWLGQKYIWNECPLLKGN